MIVTRKVTRKRYQCLKCGRIKETDTNHFGLTYRMCQCQRFGGPSVWQCLDPPPTIEEELGPVELMKAVSAARRNS